MRRPRVVIADDHPNVLRAVSKLLEESFVIVARAMDGAAALDAVLDLNPDVLVVDLAMPIKNGLEVARCLRRLHSRVRVVLLTVYDEIDCSPNAATGIHRYVAKHRAATDLVPAIELALRDARFAPQRFDKGRRRAEDN
jgi:DNA-binding NarL/FixJ family response regulator